MEIQIAIYISPMGGNACWIEAHSMIKVALDFDAKF